MSKARDASALLFGAVAGGRDRCARASAAAGRLPGHAAAELRCAGTLTPHAEWEIGEYVCTEDNQDSDELFEAD